MGQPFVLPDTKASAEKLTKNTGLSDEAVNAIISVIQTVELTDTVATKSDVTTVRTETAEGFAQLRTETAQNIATHRTETAEGFAQLRTEMAQDKAELRTEIAQLGAALRTEMSQMKSDIMTRFAFIAATQYIATVGTMFVMFRMLAP